MTDEQAAEILARHGVTVVEKGESARLAALLILLHEDVPVPPIGTVEIQFNDITEENDDMAMWQREIRLQDVWVTEDIPLISKAIAERLSQLAPFGDASIDSERDKIVEKFKILGDSTDFSIEDFDREMKRLYYWGDGKLDSSIHGKRVCWVGTF